MAKEKFKLNFITTDEGLLYIDEPFGFDSADFTLKQDDKRLGRDVSFAGGESEFTFSPMRNHYFEKLIYYYETFGWESEVELIIEASNGDNIIGVLDFYDAKTDLLTYFKCKVIQVKKEALIKKRSDVKVNMYADKDLDGNAITPLINSNTLVLAKPIKQESKWETPSVFDENLNATADMNPSGDTMTVYYKYNPSINLVKYDLEDSLTFYSTLAGATTTSGSLTAIDEFKIITAKNNITNLKIDITGLDYNVETDVDNGGNGYVDIHLIIRYGDTVSSAERHVLFNKYMEEGETYSNTNNYSLTIPYLARGQHVWLYFSSKVRQSANGVGDLRFEAFTTINSMTVNAIGTSKSYNTISPSLRLYDVISQNVKAISQLNTIFPFAQRNGEMWNQRLMNGNMLRGVTTKTLDNGSVTTLPFNVAFKDIEEWLPEINADFEVNTEVFFGLYADYYNNVESGVFTTIKFDDYEKKANPRHAINHFKYGYSKFQSKKEKDVENTNDAIHGESEWLVGNTQVENKKEVKISFIRDAFLIAETQKKGLSESETTATQDDGEIFILDCEERSAPIEIYQETDYLQHRYSNGKLTLTNIGEFSWSLLGLAVGESFEIIGGDSNAGTYTIDSVSNRSLVLIPSAGGTANNNGQRNTNFRYSVSLATAPFITATNQGFNITSNLNNADQYANLKYSVKRNIERFYNQYLASCNIWAKKPIKNTEYKNNADAVLGYNGLTTTEGLEFTPINPIINTFIHKVVVITDFATYKTLEDSIRTDRGFVRVVDRDEFVLKIYPKQMTFKNNGDLGELTIIGEEKYENSLINIAYGGLPYLLINDYHITNKIIYKEKNEKFYIFDEFNRLLYKPAFWHKITVNGLNAENKTQLREWLTLIS